MAFWLAAGGIAAVCAVALMLALWRGRVRGAVAADMGIYRDQLAAVDRDLARGVVGEAEADRLRVEIKRRILDADKSREAAPGVAPAGLTGAMTVISAGVVVGGSLWIYDVLGAPGYPDLPLAARLEAANDRLENRPSQATAEAGLPPAPLPEVSEEFATLMEQLRAAVAERPTDLQGNQLLARNEAGLGNFAAAHAAQARVLAALGTQATAADWADYADLMVLAAGGYVSPEAQAALDEALALDARNGTARFYTGQMMLQIGRPDLAFRMWERLLAESRPEAPWVPPIRAQIEDAATLAGIDWRLPPAGTTLPPGPSAADIEAAGELSATDRMAMIEGMVAGLSERLATEGGPPADWARLIRAYGVLGRRDAAAAIWAEAQQVFPDDVNRVVILEAARDAGVEQ